ncbi:MAG: NhaA family Na+:H+ antiporter [Rickettsiales bacterium]|jgi:NhaA family Na+:H+ antiporter
MTKNKHKTAKNDSLQTNLERKVSNLFVPLEIFIQKQATAALLLIAATIIALILANLFQTNPIAYIAEKKIGFLFEDGGFGLPIIEWINSGLMALFFFIIGLEIKRSILAGSLKDPRNVRLIIFTAIGGMVVPGALYSIINYGTIGQQGWAIPMATDTAFAIGILSLLTRRVSAEISIFLAALAIFDDIGAILIISIFYTENLHYLPLLQALIPLVLLVFSNKMGITNGWVFSILGAILWYFIHSSGIHGTLAGLLVAFTIPARTYITQNSFIDKTRNLVNIFENEEDKEVSMLSSKSQHKLTKEMHNTMDIASTPLQRWEQLLINPVSIIILPLFALFNAGIILSSDAVTNILESRITWGIIIGLVVGKPLGIALFGYIGIKFKIGVLLPNISLKKLVGIGMMAGIGFTMSLFITTLGFEGQPELLDAAKIGIIIASVVSALLGTIWFITQSK